MILRAAALIVALSGCDRVFGLDPRDAEIDAPASDAPPLDGPRACAFTAAPRITVSLRVGSLAAANVIGDGAIDLVVVNAQDDTITVVEGVGNGTFGAMRDFGTMSA